MENLCLEDFWSSCLKKENWSDQTILRFLGLWAPSTWFSYNCYFNQFVDFCAQNQCKLDRIPQCKVAEFFLSLAQASTRPRAVLTMSAAATSSFYKSQKLESTINEDMYRLLDGLVKTCTSATMKRTPVMPMQPFLKICSRNGM